jgi:hypothetical protein
LLLLILIKNPLTSNLGLIIIRARLTDEMKKILLAKQPSTTRRKRKGQEEEEGAITRERANKSPKMRNAEEKARTN